MKPNDYDFYRSYYIKQQIARIDKVFANASQEELEDSWQGDSELYQLQAEREYWMKKLVSRVT
tara:strand:- start:233 stop:421 length:189 start_codon:yes stop_codon:yes gene_type:complete